MQFNEKDKISLMQYVSLSTTNVHKRSYDVSHRNM